MASLLTSVVEEILVVPPGGPDRPEGQGMVSRSKTAKRLTDLADIRRLLLTSPSLRPPKGSSPSASEPPARLRRL